MPKTKLFLSLAIIVMAVALVGGATMAWFTSSDTAGPVDFQAGTLLIEATSTATGDPRWNPGDNNTEKYTVTNVGTKSSFIRALLDGQWYRKAGEPGCETAMVRMNEDPGDFTFPYKEGKNPWFTYIKETPDNSTSTFYFYAGQHHKVGEVDVSENGDNLNIDIKLIAGFDFKQEDGSPEVHINVAADEEIFMGIQGQPWAFGNWPYPDNNTLYTYDQATNTYSYSIPWESGWDGQELFIGVHGVVCGSYDDSDSGAADGDWVEWIPPDGSVNIKPCDGNGWRYGTGSEYLYYVGDDDSDCLKKVEAGQDVELCITVTFADDAGNMFQNARFILNANFEAIQTTNRAAIEESWAFTSCLSEVE